MPTLEKLFEIWDSATELAGDIGESHWAVQKWKQRGRIPSDAWPRVISAARRKGKKLSADDLLVMHEGANARAVSR